MRETGRFAPSPTGPLHAGSLVAALASWLDVRARGPQARWLVRIEDADTERCLPGMGERILRQLADCALLPDEPPVWQTQRTAHYEAALARLKENGLAYPCGCSRKDIDEALARLGLRHERHGERVYPGTCRDGLHGKPARAWRFAAEKFAGGEICFTDRRLGRQCQDVGREVGDFVLRRADGPWAYQLAVVVDDAEQGVTDVVRGEDLTDNTARQILLQRALGFPAPSYLHTPLVRGADGDKLSKQNGATAIDTSTPEAALAALGAAARALGLRPATATDCAAALAGWVPEWRALYNSRP
ncbi:MULTISPECIES: tRNA glutamyl-Q(34) synthetase GluQRS [Variovorax]|jgi:glutamyl-Q tRNA(Asp) synthetase|uniref:tRNA glutamyl-Q(34) synthetase GluQRS n=1 Tax=Variovorax TaxID=34072 RepID=UPI00086E492D|nr:MULTISPECIES: tRNA glutamyl-Q(34) synthetase GluQRS [Variovorax]MBN8752389.1 tRNA glutamyl-Q(34) synthetase GluQRS [Variovorax sp.]ODU18141.1 MAG: tRNA glutamyl-Q(34) synthetase GluQRS [Variovorax sp. SCN 67-85]ODV26739.1 MAG: tRNA glutamyl-Q(34) synthetase GluQRS [Variovorax sp. SCN 67-20]OJZ08828.1 MAG: tRNA glutamyl-Q(34) synthetase GluQRS [Variovorax sp. 67-131]UKI11286.1 tRNA glutamyl-Q(34) synthetase GluQRS [Variovorax paradoxus]